MKTIKGPGIFLGTISKRRGPINKLKGIQNG